jgi:riboflavin synthase
MFTGIVAARGQIVETRALGSTQEDGLRLRIDAGTLALDDVRLGDSIAIQGACMTVIAVDAPFFEVDVSRESLNKTCGLAEPAPVNLEKAMRLADRLGGHLVSGHVDGLGEIVHFEPIGESWRLVVALPAGMEKFVAYKGSITVNGVSLTINQVRDTAQACEIEINLIPHTLQNTTLQYLQTSSTVNLEIDLIARYCERMLGRTAFEMRGQS